MARVLIADDDETERLLLGTALEQAGHKLYFAPNGEEALRLYLRHSIDVVVTDIQMPRGDGVELIEALKGLDPDASIVAISGQQPHKLEIAQREGARSILTKPIDREGLLKAVEEAVQPPPAEAL